MNPRKLLAVTVPLFGLGLFFGVPSLATGDTVCTVAVPANSVSTTQTSIQAHLNDLDCDVVELTGSGTVVLTSTLTTPAQSSRQLIAVEGSSVTFIPETAFTGTAIVSQGDTSHLTIGNLTFDGFDDRAVRAERNLTVIGSTFQNLSTSQSGGALSVSGTLTLEGAVIFTNNFASNSGGAFTAAEVLGQNASVFFGYNEVDGLGNSGGAFYVTSGNATFRDLEIQNSYAPGNGGGAYVMGNLTVTRDTTLIANSTDSSGGAIYSTGNQTHNDISAMGSNSTGLGNGDGGALFVGGSLSVTGNAFFQQNVVFGDGGAVYSVGNQAYNGLSLTGNSSDGRGGGLYSQGSLTVTGNTSVSGNRSEMDGGAIYSVAEQSFAGFTGSGTTAGSGGILFSVANLSFSGDVSVNNFSADSDGGAFYSGGDQSFSGILTITSGNALRDGGAIYAVGAVSVDQALSASGVSADSGGVIFANSVSLAAASFTSTTANFDGGALYARQVSISGDASFSGVSSDGDGGAIYSLSNVYLAGVTASSTSTDGDGGIVLALGVVQGSGNWSVTNANAIFGSGGVIHADSASITGDFNSSGGFARSDGGAIYSRSDITITGATTISSTSVNLGSGGALFANGHISLASASLSDVYSSADGGAIYAQGDVSVTGDLLCTLCLARDFGVGGAIRASGDVSLHTAVFIDSSSPSDGGSIHSGGTVSSTGLVQFYDSTSLDGSGGAIYGFTGVDLHSATLTDNRADFGGAIYSDGFVTIGVTNLSGNSAVQGEGGGIYAFGAVSLTSAQAQGNTSVLDGGAIFSNATVTVENYSLWTDNDSNNGYGGAIAAISNISLGQAAFQRNSAMDDGGAVYTNADFTATGALLVTDNVSNSGQGGGIFALGDLDIQGGTFSDNDANEGGAFYVSGGLVAKENLSFTENNALFGDGGAVYVGGAMVAKDIRLELNVAADNGGGLRLLSTLDAQNITTSRNLAAGGSGGAISASGAVTLTGGSFNRDSSGNNAGSIEAMADLTFTGDVEFVSSTAVNGAGGAVQVFGDALFTNVEFETNEAGFYGGGIRSEGDIRITGRAVLNGNSAYEGGAISAGGQVHITKIDANSNLALTGGAIAADEVIIEGGSFFRNSALSAGGAIAAYSASLYNTFFIDNSLLDTDAYGGAIVTNELTELAFVTFSGNSADNGNDVAAGQVKSLGSIFNSLPGAAVAGAVTDLGGNLLSGSGAGWLDASTNQDLSDLDAGNAEYFQFLKLWYLEIDVDSPAVNQVSKTMIDEIITDQLMSDAMLGLLAGYVALEVSAQDALGNPRLGPRFDAGAFEYLNQAQLVINNAELLGDGLTIELDLNLALAGQQNPAGFVVKVDGETQEATVGEVSAGDQVATITLMDPVESSALVSLDFVAGSLFSQLEAYNLLASFNDLAVTNGSLIAPATASVGAAPYAGPIINIPADLGPVSPGVVITLSGQRLELVTSGTLGGLDAKVKVMSSELLEITIPALETGSHQLVVTSSNGVLSVLPRISVGAVGVESMGLQTIVKRISDTQAKVWAKNAVGQGKIQFLVNGKEIAWVRALDESDPKLRFANDAYYLVRTINLTDGKNAIEIYVDGERQRRVAYALR